MAHNLNAESLSNSAAWGLMGLRAQNATDPDMYSPAAVAAMVLAAGFASGTITANAPLSLTQTWNAGGVAFTAAKVNVTDTASAAASNLLDLQVGGTSKAWVRKDGLGYLSSSLSVGTTASEAKITVVSGYGESAMSLRGTAAWVGIDWAASGVNYFDGAAHTFRAFDGTEWARVVNGKLGIGTSSPGVPLDVASATIAAARITGTTNYARTQVVNNSGSMFFGVDSSAGDATTVAYGRYIYSEGAYPLMLYTAGIERMRIDASGNVLVGTASLESGATFHIGNAGAMLFIQPSTAASAKIRMRHGSIGNSTEFESDSSSTLTIKTADTAALTIDSSGMFDFKRLSAASAASVASTHKIAVKIAGTTYYLLASNA